ncbi:MAG TPA: immunoglobulin-like domain-containing protein, partial [Methylococcales bacterium]
ALTPDIYLSVKASVSPGSGTAKDFTDPRTYIVTAEDGSVQAYVVTVNVGAATSGAPIASVTYSVITTTKDSVVATLVPSETVTVTSVGGFTHTFIVNGSFIFMFKDGDGNTGTAIATVANIDKIAPVLSMKGENPTNLTIGTAYGESGAIATDNFDGVIGVVTSGSVKTDTAGAYTVTYTATDTVGNVAVATRIVNVTGIMTSEKAILTFAFKDLNPNVFAAIDETKHTITLTVPFNTHLTSLIPTIRISDGDTVSPTSGIAQNFSTPQTYTVTSASGAKQTYTVTVKKASNNIPVGMVDGDIIQCKTSANPFAVYIVKILGDKIYIRHIVSLEIFNYYKHLK